MRLIAVISLSLFAPLAIAQQFATEFKSTEVADGIFYIEGVDGMAGGSITLLAGEEYVALIDNGFEQAASGLLDYVREATGRPVDFIINTHYHGDHAGGNAIFIQDGATVFAHHNIRKRLLAQPEYAGGIGGMPVITFDNGVNFHLNGIEARAFHVPRAHTDGDAAVSFPGVNAFHAGDLLFNKLFPYVDLDAGGTVNGVVGFLEELYADVDDETIIIPGHGALASKADLRENIDMIIDSQKRVKALIDSGLTADEVVAEGPLAVYHDTYDWSFITTERWTRTIYRDLKENP